MRRECGECLSLNCRWLKSSTAICMKCCPLVTLFQVLKFISSTWPETSSRLAAPTQLLWLHVAPLSPALYPRAAQAESRASPVPSATFMGISATYVVCCVQEHFSSAPSTSAPQTRCSCVRHAVPSAGMAAPSAAGEGGRGGAAGGGLSLRRI